MQDRSGAVRTAGKAERARIARAGPAAAALAFEAPGWKAVLEFPGSKSWLAGCWEVEDADGSLAGLGLELNLAVASGETALVDFGAGSSVYAALERGQAASFRAGGEPPWQVLVGPPAKLAPLVVATTDRPAPASGWAHFISGKQAAALAVADFGTRGNESEITLHADGTLRAWQRFAPEQGRTRILRFWLHLVDAPVPIGARTSPQAMLAPLEVEAREDAR